MYILKSDIFDKSPNIHPAGQIFVQKYLFLNIASIIIAITAIIPVNDNVKAETK